jgi:geranylgeranyl reductase family protein
MERFDAVVVGAGPAGSTTAYRLARAGARVLLVDKARFPRDKPCGGGITLRALQHLPFGVDPVVEDRVDRFELRLGYGKRFERSSDAPLALMTQRRRLDHFLAEQAAAAGADFRDGARVGDVDARADGISLTVDGDRVEAEALIGADGVNGIVARSTGLAGGHTHGVALEGNAPYGLVSRERYRGRMVLELGVSPGGYGWVFPKGDHVNFGIGGWTEEGPYLRGRLARLCRVHGVDAERLEEVRGYRLPLRRADAPLARARVALVGDAAGLVDPVSGDGMYEAFLSGKLAAAATEDVLAGHARTLEPYAERCIRALAGNAAASWGARAALDRFPRATFAIARLPLFWTMLERLMRGEIRHPGEAGGAVKAPVRLVAALAHRAGDPGAAYRLA